MCDRRNARENRNDYKHDDHDYLAPLFPTVSIGLLGAPGAGKTTLVKELSTKSTLTHQHEKESGRTLLLGHANCRIYACDAVHCPERFESGGPELKSSTCQLCSAPRRHVRFVSFVDLPGHAALMSTMLTGAAILDGALLVLAGAAVESQTNEHLVAAEVLGIRRFVVVQNKCDLLKRDLESSRDLRCDAARRAAVTLLCARKFGRSKSVFMSQLHESIVRQIARWVFESRYDECWDAFAMPGYAEIRRAVSGTAAEGAPIVPVSVVKKVNLQHVMAAIVAMTAPSSEDEAKQSRKNQQAAGILGVVRSFDVNRPGTSVEQLAGGIVGGAVVRGEFRVGDMVTLLPRGLATRVVGIKSEKDNLQSARRGGLVALELGIDPALAVRNRLVGQVLASGPLPTAVGECKLSIRVLKGAELAAEDTVSVSRLACSVAAIVVAREKGSLRILLQSPLPLDDADVSVCLSRNGKLLAVGTFVSGLELPPVAPFDPTQKRRPKKSALVAKENAEQPLAPLPEYVTMAQSFESLEKANFREKLVIPPPIMGKTKNKLLVSNFKQICSSMKRPVEHVKTFVETELFLSGHLDAGNQLVLKGVLGNQIGRRFESAVLRYCAVWIRCTACSNYATTLTHVRGDTHLMQCPACCHSRRKTVERKK